MFIQSYPHQLKFRKILGTKKTLFSFLLNTSSVVTGERGVNVDTIYDYTLELEYDFRRLDLRGTRKGEVRLFGRGFGTLWLSGNTFTSYLQTP